MQNINVDSINHSFQVPIQRRSLSNMTVRNNMFTQLHEPEIWRRVPNWFKDKILKQADEDLGTPWPAPIASRLLDYYRTGNRESYESLVRQRQARLTTLTLAFLATGQRQWLDEAIDGVLLICEQLSWCWPEHDDCFTQHGSVFPRREQPYLDLGASEVASQLAWIVNVLGDQLETEAPGIADLVMTEISARCFIPRIRRTDWKWLGIKTPPNNWLAWIDGNLLGAALALYDGSELITEVIWQCLGGLERFLSSLPSDGAADEGFSYWWVGAGKALPALELFAQTTNQLPRDVFDTPHLREAIAFPARMHLGNQWFFSYADTVARPAEILPWHVLENLASMVNDQNSMTVAAAMGKTQEGDYCPEWGLLQNLQLVRWWGSSKDPGMHADGITLEGSTIFESRNIAILHQSVDAPRGLTVTIKGGDNAESHNHLDLGSITIALDGVPVVIDPGREMYTKQSFGPERYQMWYVQSQWHGTIQVDGRNQCYGKQYFSQDFSVTEDVESVSAALALDKAYPLEQFRWKRQITLNRTGGCVEVSEEYVHVSDPVIFLILAGNCEIDADTAVVTPILGGRKLHLSFPGAKVKQEIRMLDDPLMRSSWGEKITRLTVQLPSFAAKEQYRWYASII